MRRVSAATAARALGPGREQTSLGPYCAYSSSFVIVRLLKNGYHPALAKRVEGLALPSFVRCARGNSIDGTIRFFSPAGERKRRSCRAIADLQGTQLIACEKARSSAGGQHAQVLPRANAPCARPRPAPGGWREQQSVYAPRLHGSPAAPSIPRTASAVPRSATANSTPSGISKDR